MNQNEKQSQELLLEVEEDVREEKFLNMWRKYRSPIYTFVTFVVLGFMGHTLYEHYQYNQAATLAAIHDDALAAIDDNRITEALEKLNELEEKADSSSTQNYRIVAQIRKAELMQKQAPEGSFSAEAIDLLWSVAENPNYPLSWRHVAAYITGVNLLGHEYDRVPKKKVNDMLEDIAMPGNSFQLLANELLAQYALQEKDYDRAKTYCERVMKDKSTHAESIKLRCGAILSRIANLQTTNK